MYPLNLENQYEKYFKSVFKMYCDRILVPLLPVIKKGLDSVKNDSARADAGTDILSFIEDLRNKYGDFVSEKKLASEVAQNFNLVDEWSRAKTTEAIQKMYTRLNTPQLPGVTGRPTPKGAPGELWLTTVNPEKSLTSAYINKTVAFNVDLIKTIGKEYFDDIADTVKTGINKGLSYDDIRKNITARTGAHASRAQFWARDQVGKFFGNVTKMRQENAGIPGFIWRTMADGDVRDSHRFLEGTFHRWDKLPDVPRASKGGYYTVRLYPGQDFNCRCFAEPALGPEAADREYRPGAENLSTPDVDNKSSDMPMNWGGEGIKKRVIIYTDNIDVKNSVESALKAVDKVFKVNIGNARALTVTDMSRTDPMFSKELHGYHYYSGHIAINPDSSYKQTTMIHEFFHWIDRKVLPKSAREAYNRITGVIEKTEGFKTLRTLKKMAKSKELKDYYASLMTPNELFSRAMEQYMAKTGVDSGLVNEFSVLRAKYGIYYWLDSDFDKVYILIDDMFKGMGWK